MEGRFEKGMEGWRDAFQVDLGLWAVGCGLLGVVGFCRFPASVCLHRAGGWGLVLADPQKGCPFFARVTGTMWQLANWLTEAGIPFVACSLLWFCACAGCASNTSRACFDTCPTWDGQGIVR